MTLLLFDIDGTLLQVTEGARRAVDDAVSRVAGCPAHFDGVPFSGRTDPNIFRDILRASGISDPEPMLDDVLRTYVEVAQEAIRPENVEPLPGTAALLSRLADRNDVILGLVTGNLEPIAYHKLRSAGLCGPFSAGAFGSDHANRAALPPMAIQRVSSQTGHSFSRTRTVIVGDTRHDIQCAREAGLRSVAVCTGRFSRDELLLHTPDLLFENLQNPDAVIPKLLSS